MLDATVTAASSDGTVELSGLTATNLANQLQDALSRYVRAVVARDTQAERDRLNRVLGQLAREHGTTGPDGRTVLAIPWAAMEAPPPEVSARRDRRRGLLVFRVRHG